MYIRFVISAFVKKQKQIILLLEHLWNEGRTEIYIYIYIAKILATEHTRKLTSLAIIFNRTYGILVLWGTAMGNLVRVNFGPGANLFLGILPWKHQYFGLKY